MRHAKLAADGSVKLPPDVQAELQLVPGGDVAFEHRPNGDIVILNPKGRKARVKTGDVRNLRGLLKPPPGFVATLEDMDEGIARAVRERLDRSR